MGRRVVVGFGFAKAMQDAGLGGFGRRELAPEFWPEECRRDGDVARRAEMAAAWRLWITGPMTSCRLQGALGRCCRSAPASAWPWCRVADAMLQRARKAGVISHSHGHWRWTDGYRDAPVRRARE